MNKLIVGFIIGVISLMLLSCSGSALSKREDGPASGEPQDRDKKSGKKDKDRAKNEEKDPEPAAGAETVSGSCDKSLWARVYNPERLQVEEACKTVAGVITERSSDDDGDEHMLLKLDDGQEDILTKANGKKKDGNLVIEAVCVNPPRLKKVADTCKDYTSTVDLPQVGEHVRVTGSLVLDTHNGWAEIHPISRIERL